MASKTPLTKEQQILEDYKKKSDEILKKMYHILFRAQRKVDDSAYRTILEKLDKTP